MSQQLEAYQDILVKTLEAANEILLAGICLLKHTGISNHNLDELQDLQIDLTKIIIRARKLFP